MNYENTKFEGDIFEGTKINAEIIANPIYDNILYRVCNNYSDKLPHLVGILASEEPGSLSYAKWTKKACEKNKINFELMIVPKLVVESYIKWANNDNDVDGIIVYYPIFGDEMHENGDTKDNYLKDLVNHKKDVEGLSHYYRFNLYHDIKSSVYYTPLHNIAPCTALAVIKCLEYFKLYNNDYLPENKLCNKTATVINRSNIVGKPAALLMANDGADVYSVDIDSIFLMRKEASGKIYSTTKTMEEACQVSDIIILGVPDPNFKLDTRYIKKNTIVINISSCANIDETELLKIEGVRYIKSIGKITIAMLQMNLLSLCDNFREKKE